MTGPFALGEQDPARGAERGNREHTPLTVASTITVRDLDAFIKDPKHPGSIQGEISFTPFGAPIPAAIGVFNLFSPADEPRTKLMVYEFGFAHEGQDYYLAGRKTVRDDPGFDLWTDTTTLYTRLHRGRDTSGPVAGAGILRISLEEFKSLLGSIRPVDAPSAALAAEAIGKFAWFFAGQLWDTYGPLSRAATGKGRRPE
jgi:cholesterol oxidase